MKLRTNPLWNNPSSSRNSVAVASALEIPPPLLTRDWTESLRRRNLILSSQVTWKPGWMHQRHPLDLPAAFPAAARANWRRNWVILIQRLLLWRRKRWTRTTGGATNCFAAARSSITNLAAIPSGVFLFVPQLQQPQHRHLFPALLHRPIRQYLRRESVRIPSGDMGSATSETILELLKSSSTVLTILSLKPPAPKGLSLQQSLGRRFAWNPPALVTSVHRPHPISPKAHLGCHHFQQRWN